MLQAVGDAGRAYREKLDVKYASFCVWIAEPHNAMEIVLRVLRFAEKEVIAIGDQKLAELWGKSRVVYNHFKNEKERGGTKGK